MSDEIRAIDAVVNIWTPEALAGRPDRRDFYTGKMNVDPMIYEGLSLEAMIDRMDRAGIERAFLDRGNANLLARRRRIGR